MKETPRAFERRTGGRYDPPGWLRQLARPLDADRALPTVFRYPGPCGMKRWFEGRLETLGPPDDRILWFAEPTIHEDALGAAHFGTFAILEPLAFQPCAIRRGGVYVAENRPVAVDAPVAWVPPGALHAPLPWDELATAGAARAALAPFVAAERARVEESLGRYHEELAAMRRSGAPGPWILWHDVPARVRRRMLDRWGVAPVWTGPGAMQGARTEWA